MSRENVEVVRQRIAVKAGTRRSIEERLALRFQGVVALFASAISRSRPHSPLRRALLRHGVRLGFEALNRSDFEAAFAFHDPGIEVIEPPEVVKLGLDPVSRARAGRIHVQRRWHAEWGELRFEPDELFDLGDRLLVTARMKGSGISSGAAYNNDFANLLTLSGGRGIREEMFLDRGKALEAVGMWE
jgi:ketosteroid isomerase-like protein